MANATITLGNGIEFVIANDNSLWLVETDDRYHTLIMSNMTQEKMDGIIECLQRLKSVLP